MKKFVLLFIVLLAYIQLNGQTEGISYQAVIIGPNGQEIPGVDAQGNILPDAQIAIRFTIIDQNNNQEYQEVQITNTDRYGRVNLLIGSEDPDGFSLVAWDGASKNLNVEIDFSGGGTNFVDMSRQELTFVPYSFHRNIIARGTLVVDDVSDLNGELRVAGPTNLNSTLTVNNGNTTTLSGVLEVGGSVNLDSSLVVLGSTTINNALSVDSAAVFGDDIRVGGSAQFDGDTRFDNLEVGGTASLTGQVTINAAMGSGGDADYGAYPLRVEGSYQGIAVKVAGTRSASNNYVTFWDDDGIHGRIEGQTTADLTSDPEWISETAIRSADVIVNTFELISTVIDAGLDLSEAITRTADVRPVVSVIPGATVPSPTRISVQWVKVIKVVADVVGWIANEAMAITELVLFEHFSLSQVGVSYQSSGADYAEWLPKENPSDTFTRGELVGIRNGKASKRVFGAEKVMVVSSNPIVVGNMPGEGEESNYIRIAFMGQVPVKIIGPVSSGDYILPNELNSGFGKAVKPDDMATRDYNKIVGVAWDNFTTPLEGVNIVNTAIGINHNDLAGIVANQEKELLGVRQDYATLLNLVIQSNKALASLVPGYTEKLGEELSSDLESKATDISGSGINTKAPALDPSLALQPELLTVVISRDDIETAIDAARGEYFDVMKNASMLADIPGVEEYKATISQKTKDSKAPPLQGAELLEPGNHPFWSKMDSEPAYREEIIQYLKSTMEKKIIQEEKKGQFKFNIEFVNF